MKLRQLEIFGAIMKTGSAMSAARSLGMSQPAVSSALKKLEETLDVQLFERTNKRLVPTDEAKMLYQRSLDVFHAFEKAAFAADHLKKGEREALSVAVTGYFGSALAAKAVGRLKQEDPTLSVLVDFLPFAEMNTALLKGDIEVGIYFSPIDDHRLVMRELCAQPMICAIPRDHRLARKRVITPADVAEADFISFFPDIRTRMLQDNAFAEAGISPPSDLVVRFGHTGCQLAANGVGLALVEFFALLLRDSFPSLVFRRFKPEIQVSTFVAHLGRRPVSHVAQRFIDTVSDISREFEPRGLKYLSEKL